MDYYDYNVVNAGAAPGSYLGMDPAFLVWIPPLAPGETDLLDANDDDDDEPHYEEISVEGRSLTPAEYNRIRLSSGEEEGGGGVDRRLHDEVITEYKSRLSQGMLPIHRILEESRIRVSEESLLQARHAQQDEASDVIPNRLCEEDNDGGADVKHTEFTPRARRNKLEEQERLRSVSLPECRKAQSPRPSMAMACSKGRTSEVIMNSLNSSPSRGVTSNSSAGDNNTAASVRRRLHESVQVVEHQQVRSGIGEANSPSVTRRSKESINSIKCAGPIDLDRDFCEARDDDKWENSTSARTPRLMRRKYKDIIDLNNGGENRGNMSVNHHQAMTAAIPMKELAGKQAGLHQLGSPAKVHKSKEILREMQSPDYGVVADIRETRKQSFYDLIGEGEDVIKFADDDDECFDNKVVARESC